MFLEVLGRHGEVVGRHRIESLPLTIGRAYDNTVIVDDPYVAPHHIRLDRNEDGAIMATDLGTKNAFSVLPAKAKVRNAVLPLEGSLRMGHTLVRLRSATAAVVPEREETPGWASRAPWYACLAFALVCAFIAGETYFANTEDPSPSRYVATLGGAVTAVVIWVGFWAVLSRLLIGRPNFWLHAFTAATGLAGIAIWSLLAETIGYGFSLPVMSDVMQFGVALLAAVALFVHIKLLHPRLRWIPSVVAGGALALYGATVVTEKFDAFNDSAGPRYWSDLKVPAMRFRDGESLDAFFAGAKKLEPLLEALREEE